jgi:hypothetical protein
MKRIKITQDVKPLFDHYKELHGKMTGLAGIIQNEGIVTHQETCEFLDQVNKQIEQLQEWKENVRDYFWNNMVSDVEAEAIIEQLEKKREDEENDPSKPWNRRK